METTADVRVAAIAAKQNGVFTAAQAVGAGMSADDMRYRVRVGRWGRMHRGVFRIAGSPPTYEQAVMGGWLAGGPHAVLSHSTAAVLHGFPLDSKVIELTVPAGGRRSHRGLLIHRTGRMTLTDRATVGPFVATSPVRTLIDIAGSPDEKRLVACTDFVVTSRMASVPSIRRRLDALGRSGRPNVVRLERLLDRRYPHDRAPESPLERTLFDLLLQLPGPPIVLQYWVQLSDGSWVRLDGAWPDEMIAVEADSYRHHSSPEAWALDGTKRLILTAMGWRVLPFKHYDVTRRPKWVLQQAAAARGLTLAS